MNKDNKCPECKSKKVTLEELADSQFEPYDELTCLKCGHVWYETPSDESIQEWHDRVIEELGLEEDDLTPPEDWNLKELQDNQTMQLASLFAIPLMVLDPKEWLRGAVAEFEQMIKPKGDENDRPA